MTYKERLSEIYSILTDLGTDVKYTKEKDFLFLECTGIETPKHKDLTLKLKIKYDDLMLNEMNWAYSADFGATDHYILRKDTLASIEQSLKSVIDKEMFNQTYLDTLPKNESSDEEKISEAKNTVYLKVLNEITSLNLGMWKIEFMNADNDYLLFPLEKGLLKDDFKLTVEVLNSYDALKMLELKQEINNDQAYHEILRVKDVLKRLI